MKIKPGEIFQRAKIRDEITRLTDLYGSRGYAFADVVPNVNPNNEERTATIILNIKEGEMMRDPADPHQRQRQDPRQRHPPRAARRRTGRHRYAVAEAELSAPQ